ncbi:putative hydroxypyruvate isomerase isoform X1 [Megalobrama amblycephala]|uniref:putative hydroxypyruvate isomerase isoform X1 n=1 Tax=Megalobrama amblycephala TaxID=75352 RepID=UPI002013F526|nr:putative hydroxypyruvate isomerase isoform X1 [Megalobrama amblycephala]
MAPLKFCANISWLFTELPEFTQRMRAAARAGFRAVEAAWIYSADLKELKAVKDETGLEFALINTPPGDLNAGDLGLGAVPGREQEFRQGLDLAVRFAKALDCRRIHLMAGRVPAGADRSAVSMEMEDTFVQNLKHAAGVLSKEGILGLIEPINTRITDPRYFLDSPNQAAVILQRVSHPSIRMQMDIYHWQIMDGNLTQNIRKYLPMTALLLSQVTSRSLKFLTAMSRTATESSVSHTSLNCWRSWTIRITSAANTNLRGPRKRVWTGSQDTGTVTTEDQFNSSIF